MTNGNALKVSRRRTQGGSDVKRDLVPVHCLSWDYIMLQVQVLRTRQWTQRDDKYAEFGVGDALSNRSMVGGLEDKKWQHSKWHSRSSYLLPTTSI